jgi:hypothetical protein
MLHNCYMLDVQYAKRLGKVGADAPIFYQYTFIGNKKFPSDRVT